MPPSADPKVLAIVDRVLARNCSINTAIQEVCGAFADTKSEEAFRRNVRKHVQKRRAANDVAEAAEAEAGTAKHYTKAAEKAAAAAQLAAAAAATAAGKAVKAAAAPQRWRPSTPRSPCSWRPGRPWLKRLLRERPRAAPSAPWRTRRS